MKKEIKKIGMISGLTMLTLHVINKIMYKKNTTKKLLEQKETLFYEWRYGKIKYTKQGTGTPLLLIHNLSIGSSSYEFKNIESELAKTNELYTLDLLGYGLSEKPGLTFTNFLYVQLITDYIENIIKQKANVITSGSSSSIALMAQHNNSKIIDKMIFINPDNISDNYLSPSNHTKLIKKLIEIPILGTFCYNIFASKAFITNTFKTEYFYDTSLIDDNDIKAFTEAAHIGKFSAKYSFSSDIGKYLNIDFVHALKNAASDIIIILGKENDNIESTKEGYLNFNKNIQYSFIKETKKLPHLERPEEILKEIKIYL